MHVLNYVHSMARAFKQKILKINSFKCRIITHATIDVQGGGEGGGLKATHLPPQKISENLAIKMQ